MGCGQCRAVGRLEDASRVSPNWVEFGKWCHDRCFMLRDDLRKWLYDLCLSLSLYVCIYILSTHTIIYIYINITHSTTVYYNHTLYIISYTHICAFACVCICTLQLHIATSSDLSIMIVITHITILVTIIAHNNKQWYLMTIIIVMTMNIIL